MKADYGTIAGGMRLRDSKLWNFVALFGVNIYVNNVQFAPLCIPGQLNTVFSNFGSVMGGYKNKASVRSITSTIKPTNKMNWIVTS